MAFFSFLDDSSGVWTIFAHDKVRYAPLGEFGQQVMRGRSSLSAGDRELIAAFVSALNQCEFCVARHSATAAKLGVDVSVLKGLVESVDGAAIPDRLKPIFRFVKKLTEHPEAIAQADVDAVFAAGWEEAALEDAIVVCAFLNMVNRLATGHGIEGPRARGRAQPDR